MNTRGTIAASLSLWPALYVVIAACQLSADEPPRQWRPVELTFASDRDVKNPFDSGEIDFSVEFTGPDKRPMLMPGFWDGGRTWKVRFVPTQPGKWKYRTVCQPENGGL